MKVYIAGPINGRPDGNRAAFAAAAAELKRLGLEPVNPHNIFHGHEGYCRDTKVGSEGHAYGCYMRPDLQALLECDGITYLDGWENSRGACVEHEVANICGLAVITLGSEPCDPETW